MVVSFVLMVCFLFTFEIPSVMAIKYLGEFCWQTDDGDILELGVTHIGDGHYLVTGKLVETDGKIEPVNGNAEIINNKVYMTTSSAGGHASETWTFTGRWVLEKATLNGTVEIMGVYHDKTSPDPEHAGLDYDGPFAVTFVPCP